MTVLFNQKTVFNMKNSYHQLYILNVSLYSKLFSNPDFPNLNKNLANKYLLVVKVIDVKMHFHFAILAKTLWKSTAFFASNIFSPFDTSNYPWNIKVLTLPLYNFIQRQSYSEIRINCHHYHLALIIFSCLVRAWSNSKI